MNENSGTTWSPMVDENRGGDQLELSTKIDFLPTKLAERPTGGK